MWRHNWRETVEQVPMCMHLGPQRIPVYSTACWPHDRSYFSCNFPSILCFDALMSKNYSHIIHTQIIIIANYHNTITNNQIERRGREKFGDFVLIWSCPVLDESTSTNKHFFTSITNKSHIILCKIASVNLQFSKLLRNTTLWHLMISLEQCIG